MPISLHRCPKSDTTTRLLASRLLDGLVLLACVACGLGSAPETIDRELFIQTYVDLRTAALDTDSQRLANPDRASILDRHGLTEDDLLRFAEVHSSDLDFIRDLWNDVELRLDRLPEGN